LHLLEVHPDFTIQDVLKNTGAKLIVNQVTPMTGA
jgi:acyl CoA:acetate/3-ketoacid CoA transferase beta subunit